MAHNAAKILLSVASEGLRKEHLSLSADGCIHDLVGILLRPPFGHTDIYSRINERIGANGKYPSYRVLKLGIIGGITVKNADSEGRKVRMRRVYRLNGSRNVYEKLLEAVGCKLLVSCIFLKIGRICDGGGFGSVHVQNGIISF